MNAKQLMGLMSLTLTLAACGSQPQTAVQTSSNPRPTTAPAALVPGAKPQASPFVRAQSVVGDCTVTPKRTLLTIARGETATVTKNVCVPAIPPALDFDLIVDNSGSYGDDIGTLKSSGGGLAASMANGIRSGVADSMFGLGTFVDFPIPLTGSVATDYAYARNQDLTFSIPNFLTAVDNMVLRYGGDEPESQYEALYQTATGSGRDINGNSSYADLGDVAPGLGVGFRSGAAHVIALTTDASFHVPGGGYPGPSQAATIAALKAKGIQVIGLKAPGAGSELDQIVAQTGGAIKTTTSSSSDIVSAVLSALSSLTYPLNVTATAGCPLTVTYSPSPLLLTGGTTTSVQEIIKAPTAPGNYTCTMTFMAGGLTLGTEEITVRVR